MIRVIQGVDLPSFPSLMDAMFKNRKEVFYSRLGWDVEVQDDWETDRFDKLNPLYFISVDPETDAYQGSVRILPTTGPNMLRDVFPQLLEDDEIVESPLIWEASRFCVSRAIENSRSRQKISLVSGEIISGAFEVGLLAGLKFLVAVFDVSSPLTKSRSPDSV